MLQIWLSYSIEICNLYTVHINLKNKEVTQKSAIDSCTMQASDGWRTAKLGHGSREAVQTLVNSNTAK